jgi:hypothetical protein
MATPLKDAGNAHLAAGRLDEALAAYDAALAAGEGMPVVLHANRAAALLRVGRHEAALGAADAALAVDGAHGKALFRRAQALEGLDRLGEALVALRRLHALDRDNRECATMLRRLHAVVVARAATAGLCGAADAVAGVRAAGASIEARATHARKLAAIAADRERAAELCRLDALGALVSALPADAVEADAYAHAHAHAEPQQPKREAADGASGGEGERPSHLPPPRFEEVDTDAAPAADARGADGRVATAAAVAPATSAPSAAAALGAAGVFGACVDGLVSLLIAATPSAEARAAHADLGGVDASACVDASVCAELRARAAALLPAGRAVRLAHRAMDAAVANTPSLAAASARPDVAASPWRQIAAQTCALLARLASAAASDDADLRQADGDGGGGLAVATSARARSLELLRGLASLTDRVRGLPCDSDSRKLCRGCVDAWLLAAAHESCLAAAAEEPDVLAAIVWCLLPFGLADRGAALAGAGLARAPGAVAASARVWPSEASDPDGSQRHGALAALTPLLRPRGEKGAANEAAILRTIEATLRPALAAADAAAARGAHGEARALRASCVEVLSALAELNRQAAARACVHEAVLSRSADWHEPAGGAARADAAVDAADADVAGRRLAVCADERFCVGICELCAHALAGSELLSDPMSVVSALSTLKACVQHAQPHVRCRALVALAKLKAVHAPLRNQIVSLRALLRATLALLTAAQPRAPDALPARGGAGAGAGESCAGASSGGGLDLRVRSQLSTYRWAVEGLMFLVAMGEAKGLLLGATDGAGFASFKALATFLHQATQAAHKLAHKQAGGGANESPAVRAAQAASALAVSSLHYPLAWCVWRLVGAREVSADEKRLLREMAPEQIAKFKKLARGQAKAADGGGAGGGEEDEEDDERGYAPALLQTLRERLVRDDGVCLLAEIANSAGGLPHAASTRAACAKALLALAELPAARGQLCAQGGFSACLLLANGPGKAFGDEPGAPPRALDEPASARLDREASEAAAIALAKMAISVDPAMLPGHGGAASAQAGLVRPLLRLLETSEHELFSFEATLALTNLAAAGADSQARLMREGCWRRMQLALAEDNVLLRRAAVECLANLSSCDEALDLLAAPGSQDLKVGQEEGEGGKEKERKTERKKERKRANATEEGRRPGRRPARAPPTLRACPRSLSSRCLLTVCVLPPPSLCLSVCLSLSLSLSRSSWACARRRTRPRSRRRRARAQRLPPCPRSRP